MDNDPDDTYRTRAAVLKALAHPTRLFIVDHLSLGPACVADLTNLIGHDMSTVSRHLAVLKDRGIVVGERRGAQIFYHLQTPCVCDFFGCLERVQKQKAQLIKDLPVGFNAPKGVSQ